MRTQVMLKHFFYFHIAQSSKLHHVCHVTFGQQKYIQGKTKGHEVPYKVKPPIILVGRELSS